MSRIYNTLDKLNPFYQTMYNIVLFVCKILLIIDILITSFAVLGRFVPFIPDPSWSEEVVLTLMAYIAVLSAALAIRRKSHIKMTAFDKFLSKKSIILLDILANLAVTGLSLVMIIVGWRYAVQIGSLGSYVSMPSVSRFWMYFPVPLAGVAMLIFEIEVILANIKDFLSVKEETA